MKRVSEFQARPNSEAFLQELNQLVAQGEENLDITSDNKSPLIFIVGAPRSGTTVLLQWLTSIGVAAPSNIAARFPRNPLFGGMLQRLLTDPDLNYRDELSVDTSTDFQSNYGKTQGILSPHEYSFFIRNYFPTIVGHKLNEAERGQSRPGEFSEDLQKFAAAVGKPLVTKGLLFQYDMDLVDFDNVLFLHTHRDEADNVCSIYNHRVRVASDVDEWISVRPSEYDWLKDLDPLLQIAGQVCFTNEAIKKQASRLKSATFIDADHAAFCNDPAKLHQTLDRWLDAFPPHELGSYNGPDTFTLSQYDKGEDLYQRALDALAEVKMLKGKYT